MICFIREHTPALKEFSGKGYADFKSALAKVTVDYFAPIRKKKEALLKKSKEMEKIFSDGSLSAKKIASKKLEETKKAVFSRVFALAFIKNDNPTKKTYVDHINGDTKIPAIIHLKSRMAFSSMGTPNKKEPIRMMALVH